MTQINSSNNVPKIYRFGSFWLDAGTRRLWESSRSVKLPARAFDILLYLVERHGAVIEREELLQKVWHEDFVEDANLTVHIGSLRRALGEEHGEERFIATIFRRGYCFVAPVREVKDEAELKVAPQLAQPITSLAVLPLQISEKDEALEYLADGVTETLISSLSKLAQLKVLASSTVFRYKQTKREAQAIGDELGVATILTGKLRRVGDELLISVELVNTMDGRQLWGEQYHQLFTDIIELQERIALTITEKLLPHLSETDKIHLKTRYTENSEAYRAFMMGQHFSNKRTKKALEKGLEYFQKAVDLDPAYALAHFWIAYSYYFLDSYYHLSHEETLPHVTESLDRAFALDPNLPEAHVLSGILKFIYEWNWTQAETEFQKAIEVDPNNILARNWYANFLRTHKRFDEAWLQLNRGLEIDPLSLSLNILMGGVFYFQRRYKEAVAQFRETSEVYPDSIAAHAMTAICLQNLGEGDIAVQEMRKAYELAMSSEILALLGSVLTQAGEKEEALQILGRIENDSAPVPFEIFYLYLALEQTDEAIAFLEKSLAKKDIDLITLNADPRADSIRSEIRFIAIMKRIGFKV